MQCELENIKIYYEIHGKGIPILMVHGFMPDHRVLKGCMEPIFQNNLVWEKLKGKNGLNPLMKCLKLLYNSLKI
ncbi:MAG: hypothetical protein ACXACC_01450 [Promethearchaeota archaeon]